MSNHFDELLIRIPAKTRKLVQKQNDIAEQIDRILVSKPWTHKDLADAMGKKESYVSRIMAGATNLTLKSIVSIEIALEEEILKVPMFHDVKKEKDHFQIGDLSQRQQIPGANQSIVLFSSDPSLVGLSIPLSEKYRFNLGETPTDTPADYGYMAAA